MKAMHVTSTVLGFAVAVVLLQSAPRATAEQSAESPPAADSPGNQSAEAATNTIQLTNWNFVEAKEFAEPDLQFTCLQFSDDGKLLCAAGEFGECYVWDTSTWKQLLHLEHHTIIWNIDFSSAGDKLLTCGEDSTLALWDIATGKLLKEFRGHENAVRSCAISADGKRVIGGGGRSFQPAINQPKSADFSVRIWDAETGKQLDRLDGHSEEVRNVAFLPTGEQAASTALGPEMVIVWDLKNSKPLRTINAVETMGAVEDVKAAFSPSVDTVLTVGETYFSGGMLRLDITERPPARLWDLTTGRQIHDFGINTRGELYAAFGPLPETFVSVDRDHHFQRDPEDFEEVADEHGGGRLTIGTIRLRDIKSGKLVAAYIRGGPQFSGLTPTGPIDTCPKNNLVACGRLATGLLVLKLVETKPD